MRFILQYLFHNDVYSCGFMKNEDGSYTAFVVADPPRDKKIKGITRFKAGLYELKIKEVLTPLTIKHRAEYNKGEEPWFEFHIEVTGINDFDGCYVHIGNDASHTEGCVLPNYDFNLAKSSNQGSLSKAATKDFYRIVYPLLKKGVRCFIEVKDEQI